MTEAQGYMDAPTQGAQWAIGIDEVNTVTVKIGDRGVTYSNVVAQESGLNLINAGQAAVGNPNGAVAFGGPFGVWSDIPLDPQRQIHEGQHIAEQEDVGWLAWHSAYQAQYWTGVFLYGDMGSAYDFHSAENRARAAAGQATYDPGLDDLWFWP